MVHCKSTPVWPDIIPVNWAEASERIRQQFVYIFADFNFSNDLWSLWVRILQQIRPALASRWLTNWHDCEVLILQQPSSSIVWYPVSANSEHQKTPHRIHVCYICQHLGYIDGKCYHIYIYIYHTWILWALTLLIWFRICIPLSSFLSMLLTLPRSTFLPAPWSTIHHTGRPTIAPRRQAASGCCSGTAVAKAGSSARRFSSEAKWGNLGGFTRWSLGGIYGIEIYWNILTYYWNDRDFQPTIEIIWVSSFGKECVSNHWKWSKMKALRFFKSLKQWGFMMRDIRRVLENMYINFYHKWWIWPSRIVEMSCYFFLGSKMTTRKLFEQHWSFQIFQIIKPEINIENISATTNGPPARSMVSMSATLLLDLNPKPSRVGELWDDASAGEDYNFKDISVLSLPILSSAGIWWCIYI